MQRDRSLFPRREYPRQLYILRSNIDFCILQCPNVEARTCRNCGSKDHIAKECDQPRNPDLVTCRNCEKLGHFSRDCPEPKDWSKVKCSNCGEMGHTIKVRTLLVGEGSQADSYSAARSLSRTMLVAMLAVVLVVAGTMILRPLPPEARAPGTTTNPRLLLEARAHGTMMRPAGKRLPAALLARCVFVPLCLSENNM